MNSQPQQQVLQQIDEHIQQTESLKKAFQGFRSSISDSNSQQQLQGYEQKCDQEISELQTWRSELESMSS